MVNTRRSRRRPQPTSPVRQPETSTRSRRRNEQPAQTTGPEQETVSTPEAQTATPHQVPTMGEAPLQPPPLDHPFLVGVNAVLEELRKQNQSLQQQVNDMKQDRDPNALDSIQIEKPQPLTDSIMNDLVPQNFKPPPLEPYDGRKDP